MTARALAKLVGTFHNVSYYAPEMKAFADLGLPEYWRAYMAYRSAPMGVVPAPVVQATFYNFSPAVVGAAIPSAWTTTTPQEVMQLRDTCITTALHRGLATNPEQDTIDLQAVERAGDLALCAAMSADAGARPLFAAHRALPLPDEPILRLWYACTLWREHRGDSHNLALAAAGIDGIECHALLAAKGVGSQEVITKIRGWTEAEWHDACDRLVERGFLTPTHTFTDEGQDLRRAIENHTDRLCESLIGAVSPADANQLIGSLEPLVGVLLANGVVPGRWPPSKPPR